ncbi:MAG: hypothetical protein ACC726_05855 [Chloroflexota bacterium]
MTTPTRTAAAHPESPIGYSDVLGRRIRQDDLATLGISTQTLAEDALRDGHWDLAAELVRYFVSEIRIMNEVLFVWMADILDYRLARGGADETGLGATLLRGYRAYDPGRGDLDRSLAAIEAHDADAANAAIELMRVRWAAQHDGLVVWIQEVLSEIAESFGEDAIREVVTLAYEHIWKPRYELWPRMSPEERLQLSVEGMRGGHLSGPRHRGDVGLSDEGDRYVMSLDPCGSCGVLRRGDPDSGRPPHELASNKEPHQWTQGRTGMGWYSVHSMIALEYIQMNDGQPPLRPLEDCDLPDRPCRWFIYKDSAKPRAVHYERQGFKPPPDAP